MKVLTHIDAGVTLPFELGSGEVTFEVGKRGDILNVLLQNAPKGLRVNLRYTEDGDKFFRHQGLILTQEGRMNAIPLEETGTGVLSCKLPGEGGDAKISLRYPYGRDALDALLADTAGAPKLHVRTLRRDHRQTTAFEFGDMDNSKRVHVFFAGEDTWETAGCWVADGMVRLLATGGEPTAQLLKDANILIVPLASPYSSTQECGSYTTLDGRGICGAATWGDDVPPPEYALLRDKVVRLVRGKRLGLMLTIHSWQAAWDHSGLETIRTAGERALEGRRKAWAEESLQALIKDVPKGKAQMSEKIWHPGLARDYLLAEYDAITFRIEITTHGQGIAGFRETARALLTNTARIADWSKVLEDADDH